MLRINDIAPDFDADSTHGNINFHEFINMSGQYFFHTQKISPQFVQLNLVIWQKFTEEFKKRGCKILGIKYDSVKDHLSEEGYRRCRWCQT